MHFFRDKNNIHNNITIYFIRYTYSGSHKKDVEAIYKLRVKTDQSKIKSSSYEENRKLLWHGTKPENLIGILTNGLLINAPYSHITGRSLGEGLYLGMIFKISSKMSFVTTFGHKHYKQKN